MSKNIFFERKGPFKLNILFPNYSSSKINIKDIKTLDKAEKMDLTFFDSLNYKHLAEETKASCSRNGASFHHFASQQER